MIMTDLLTGSIVQFLFEMTGKPINLKTFDEALEYVKSWLGEMYWPYAEGQLVLGQPYFYGGGDFVEIQEE